MLYHPLGHLARSSLVLCILVIYLVEKANRKASWNNVNRWVDRISNSLSQLLRRHVHGELWYFKLFWQCQELAVAKPSWFFFLISQENRPRSQVVDNSAWWCAARGVEFGRMSFFRSHHVCVFPVLGLVRTVCHRRSHVISDESMS